MTAILIAYVAMTTPTFTQPDLTPAEKKQTIEALLKNLDESYVFPEKAKEVRIFMEKKMSNGLYSEITEPAKFATELSKDINGILKDAHFRVRFSESVLPSREDDKEPSPAEVAEHNQMVRRQNAGIQKVERLPCNIGYLDVNSFLAGAEIARPAAAAFDFLADTDALILDLRRNGGGEPEAIRILCSYLFSEKPVHLNSIYWRPTNETTEFWTLQSVPGKRYLEKPVFVLTSKRTGSGAEECAYNIQTQKRGTIVGEVTWGGANPGGGVRLNEHFMAFIPMGRAINPITKTNWEGVGVQPDVSIAADKSLDKAQALSLEKLIETATGDWKVSLKSRLDEINKGLAETDAVFEILRKTAAGI